MSEGKCCDNCENYLYICEGDYICELEMSKGASILPIKEEHTPTDHYFWCGGKRWRKV